MNIKLPFFEKYSIAPSPNRDYYGIKVFADQVILYHWKISHGPHLFPIARAIKFSELRQDKAAKELIEHVFGTNVLRYLELAASSGPNTLLTLPRGIIEKLVTYLNLKDITELLRTSAISSEVFDTEPIWRILYKQLKALANLTEMEKEAAASRGFKKLVKDHHTRSAAKKSIKLMDDKPKRSVETGMSKTHQVSRSASVNIPKTTLQGDSKAALAAKQQHNKSHSSQAEKPFKPKVKTEEPMPNLPKKSMSEEKSSTLVESDKLAEKNIAIEAYRSFKSIDESASKKILNAEKKAMSKFNFVNQDRERTELLLPKKFLKGALGCSELSGKHVPHEREQLLKSKSTTIASRKSSFCKRSSPALGDLQVESPSKQVGKGKKPSEPTRPVHKQHLLNKAASKSARNEERSDDSDESGMSFLMKRYLEASSEVAKKFSECQRLASATRNSSVQVDMSERADRKPPKKMQKYYAPPSHGKSAARKKLH